MLDDFSYQNKSAIMKCMLGHKVIGSEYVVIKKSLKGPYLSCICFSDPIPMEPQFGFDGNTVLK